MAEIVTQSPRALALTDAAIYRLSAPGKRTTIRDGKLSQLVLTIGPKSRAWYVHATVHRQTRRVALGRFPIVGVEDARKKALDALRRLYAGEDPRTKREPALTLRQALERYLAGRKLRDTSAADCRSVIEHHAAPWLDRPVVGVGAEAVARQYRAVGVKSVAQANKMMRNLSAVMRYVATAYGAGDPDVVKKARVLLGGLEALPLRENVVPDVLQAHWFGEVSKLPDALRRLLLALALTGCRRDELRLAPSSSWDSAARMLRIEQTKSGKPHTLPAGAYLARLLDQSSSERLFVVGEHELRAAYERIAAAIGFAWTPHDLRRGVATHATRLGIEEVMVKRLLNHAPLGVTQTHYVRLSVDDLRGPVQLIEDRLLALWGAQALGLHK